MRGGGGVVVPSWSGLRMLGRAARAASVMTAVTVAGLVHETGDGGE